MASPRRRMRARGFSVGARGFSPGARGASPNEVDNRNDFNRRRRRARDASPGARGASPVPELRRSIRQGVRVPSVFGT